MKGGALINAGNSVGTTTAKAVELVLAITTWDLFKP